MHILCVICSDLINQVDNIYVTKCGHIFHFHCLSQWIERSKTCPQCRNKVTSTCMFRLYPTVPNDNSTVDAITLQSRLDDAGLQLRQQLEAFREQLEEMTELKAERKRNEKLLRTAEKKIDSSMLLIMKLKDQLTCLLKENTELYQVRDENATLKENLKTLSSLQTVLDGTTEEVNEMLEDYDDIKTVAVFASALKSALCSAEKKREIVKHKMHTFQGDLNRELTKKAKIIKGLTTYKDKYMALRDTLRRKRAAAEAAGGPRAKVARTVTTEGGPAVAAEGAAAVTAGSLNHTVVANNQRRRRRSSVDVDASADAIEASVASMVSTIESASSPYLQLRQSNSALSALQRRERAERDNLKPSEFGILNHAKSTVTNKPVSTAIKLSIFTKNPLKVTMNLSEMGVAYDGLGGHSKEEAPAPTPTRARGCVPKLTAKHKLKRPPVGNKDAARRPPAGTKGAARRPPAGNKDISQMLTKTNDKKLTK